MTGTSKTRTAGGTISVRDKVEHPAKVFSEPTEVVADPKLSTHQKLRALDSLEQDARQLAAASAEGMSGGEETQLRGVLEAKRTLELPPADVAFTVVLRTLEAKLADTLGTDTHAVLISAIDAIHAAREAMEEDAETPAPPPGAPKPGSAEELAEELAKEKLDP